MDYGAAPWTMELSSWLRSLSGLVTHSDAAYEEHPKKGRIVFGNLMIHLTWLYIHSTQQPEANKQQQTKQQSPNQNCVSFRVPSAVSIFLDSLSSRTLWILLIFPNSKDRVPKAVIRQGKLSGWSHEYLEHARPPTREDSSQNGLRGRPSSSQRNPRLTFSTICMSQRTMRAAL